MVLCADALNSVRSLSSNYSVPISSDDSEKTRLPRAGGTLLRSHRFVMTTLKLTAIAIQMPRRKLNGNWLLKKKEHGKQFPFTGDSVS